MNFTTCDHLGIVPLSNVGIMSVLKTTVNDFSNAIKVLCVKVVNNGTIWT